ncbi:MAG TPA: 4Fe-4S binding protein [Thermoflexus sp.]|nr:4Fe-4S binding protein [Thermoflexus sp.]
MAARGMVREFVHPRLELTRWAPLQRIMKHRAFQFMLILPNLAVFVLVLVAAFFGTPVGNRNFAIIFVWIVWWAALITLLIPLAGRIWCAMCPIPAPGEWLQRLAVIARRPGRPFTLGLSWPKALRNIWLQNGTFLAVALFSAIILTRPLATGIVLTVFIGLALLLSLLFERRVFCRYVCPVGGFIGLYAMVAPLELRVKDPQICVTHKEKDCIRGNANGYPCPWLSYPGNLWRNIDCGLCTECLKACPKENVGLFLRPFGQDLLLARAPGWKGRSLDEAYKAFIMLSCALIYSAVYIGPWGFLKEWANLSDPAGFALYAAGFLGLNLIGLPGLFLIAVAAARWIARADVPLRRLFTELAYALVPLGLAGWIAFTLSFVLINISYAIPLFSDPLGRGWDLLGTASYPWTPYMPELVPFLQLPFLWVGLIASIVLAFRIAQQNFGDGQAARRALLPIAGFITLIVLLFQRLYLG